MKVRDRITDNDYKDPKSLWCNNTPYRYIINVNKGFSMNNPVKKFMDRMQKPTTHKSKKDIINNKGTHDLMTSCYIKVSEDFGLIPSGNKLIDGPYSFESFDLLFNQEILTAPRTVIDFKNCLSVGSSFLNQLALFVLTNHLENKLDVISEDKIVSDKYQKYLITNKVV